MNNTTNSTTAYAPPGSLERMVRRLATRGLLPVCHNLTIWQHVDDNCWGVAIVTPYPTMNAEAHGATIEEALEGLMRETNRGADLPPNDPSSASAPKARPERNERKQ